MTIKSIDISSQKRLFSTISAGTSEARHYRSDFLCIPQPSFLCQLLQSFLGASHRIARSRRRIGALWRLCTGNICSGCSDTLGHAKKLRSDRCVCDLFLWERCLFLCFYKIRLCIYVCIHIYIYVRLCECVCIRIYIPPIAGCIVSSLDSQSVSDVLLVEILGYKLCRGFIFKFRTTSESQFFTCTRIHKNPYPTYHYIKCGICSFFWACLKFRGFIKLQKLIGFIIIFPIKTWLKNERLRNSHLNRGPQRRFCRIRNHQAWLIIHIMLNMRHNKPWYQIYIYQI